MTKQLSAFVGAQIFDGASRQGNAALLVRGSQFAGIVPDVEIPSEAKTVVLDGGTVAPGYVDLQVNGGGGIMFNDTTTVEALAEIARAHALLGATSVLPTLITDTPRKTRAAIDATRAAVESRMVGIIGLHLEGPHLSPARKGAHDPSLIRPMGDADVEMLIDAAKRLPVLKVTIAPESVTTEQMRQLTGAGILLSLGHTDCGIEDVRCAVGCGARCVTHLFNAMSQLGGREPGLVGGALSIGELSAGLIADRVHVHPDTIRLALAAKRGPGRLFLVSDAMATAGSDIDHFFLNGRRIERRNSRLALADGTLAGADLDLSTAIRNLADIGVPLDEALAMATSIPARLAGAGAGIGHIEARQSADFIHLDERLMLRQVWRKGRLIHRCVDASARDRGAQ